MKSLIVSIHDVTPSTAEAARCWRALIARRDDGPASLLVVPHYGGRELWLPGPGLAWLHWRAQAGDEIVLHGNTHVTASGRDGPELRGLPWPSAAQALRDGRHEMGRRGLAPAGLVCPAYGLPRHPEAACRAAGLRWWATRTTLRWNGGRRPLPSVGLGASTLPRRLLSPSVLRPAVRALARAPVVRLDLHPADLGHDRLASAGLWALEELLAQGRRLVTHADLLPHARVPAQDCRMCLISGPRAPGSARAA
jgi:predicted deacetylase